MAQNDNDLSCIKLDINVSKCCAFVKHFETVISSLIQDKSVSFWAISVLHIFYLLFCTGHIRGHLGFHGIAIKLSL